MILLTFLDLLYTIITHKWHSTLATWCKELTHWERPWCWERLKAGGEGDDRGWDGWMASPTQWTWVWVSSGSWWWTGKSGVLQSMASHRVRHDWVTQLNSTDNPHQIKDINFVIQCNYFLLSYYFLNISVLQKGNKEFLANFHNNQSQPIPNLVQLMDVTIWLHKTSRINSIIQLSPTWGTQKQRFMAQKCNIGGGVKMAEE